MAFFSASKVQTSSHRQAHTASLANPKETEMKNSKIIAAAALTLLAAAGAHADAYNYVSNIPTTSVYSRSEVNAQAVIAAHGADVYRDSALQNVQPAFVSSVDRDAVRAGAIAAARAPYQNMQLSSFVNSEIPAARNGGNTPRTTF
jgi:hypothetical protein